nr:MAG TPA: hypothetical protein [Caudoviricetes sp.]
MGRLFFIKILKKSSTFCFTLFAHYRIIQL